MEVLVQFKRVRDSKKMIKHNPQTQKGQQSSGIKLNIVLEMQNFLPCGVTYGEPTQQSTH